MASNCEAGAASCSSVSPNEVHGEDPLKAWKSKKKHGIFSCPWPGFYLPGIGGAFKWKLTAKNESKVPADTKALDEKLPILTPDFETLKNPPADKVCLTWIGHASTLVQIEGVNVLTDPVFSNRCSPVSFAGPTRYRDPPCTVEELPRIDAVVISHNHYDHLDLGTVRDLNKRVGNAIHWFVPLGLKSWMISAGCKLVSELDWWQEGQIGKADVKEMDSRSTDDGKVKFIFTPAQHWCRRGAMDTNKVLWGSWCIVGPHKRFFFAGDTGYCGVFKVIGEQLGPFDLAAIPIGAYEPRWFMTPQHVNPAEAIKIHNDIKARKSIGIHWGTFVLTDEFYLEPRDQLAKDVKSNGLDANDFVCIKHGETI